MLTVEQIIACGLEEAEASEIAETVNRILPTQSPTACWHEISRYILTPQHPFALHQLLYETVYADFDRATHGPPPAWFPTDKDITKANITRLMAELQIKTYPEFHAWSVANRDAFWQMMIDVLGIKAAAVYTEAQQDATGISTRLAKLNIVESCFNGPDDAIAVVTQRESDTSLKTLTYYELESLTSRVANGLVEIGMKPGDAVAIDMPMNAESVALYLGIVKAGCVVVGIADSFAPDEIATRLRIGNAKTVFTQDYINRAGKRLPLYEKVIAANAPKTVVFSSQGSQNVAHIRREDDMAWVDFLSNTETFAAVPCYPDANTNILFSSGTHRRTEGDSVDTYHPHQIRRRCLSTPRCPLRRCAGMAYKPRLDDGTVAYLRQSHQQCHDRIV